MSVASCYTKLKGLRDELASYNDLPICTCAAKKEHVNRAQREKVMQFLMGLSDSYLAVCSQILLMHPLTSVNKSYSLILQEEKQSEVASFCPSSESMAMMTSSGGINYSGKRRSSGKSHGTK